MASRSGAIFGGVFAVLSLAALLLLGAPFRELALPYAVLLSVATAVVGLWGERNWRFMAGFLAVSCGVLVPWGLGGTKAAVIAASWGLLWFGLGGGGTELGGSTVPGWLGGESRLGGLAGVILLLFLFSPFYACSLGPEGGFWLWFSLHSGPLPALWRVSGYDGRVGALLYNRWYGTLFPVIRPSWWVLSLAWLVPGTILSALRLKKEPRNLQAPGSSG